MADDHTFIAFLVGGFALGAFLFSKLRYSRKPRPTDEFTILGRSVGSWDYRRMRRIVERMEIGED
jgi:hypothetical protein